MKRSTVNGIIEAAQEFIASFRFRLPPIADLTPDEFRTRKHELKDVIDARLGWDITDYGAGKFDEMGLFLFTLRNGRLDELQTGGMCYAEKLMISRRDQLSPMHRHLIKTEDIINRGGAPLAIKMFESGPDGTIDEKAQVPVARDGVRHTYPAGETILLQPGESITLRPGNWHAFWGEGGDTLIGEVSTVNDDLTDNVFADPIDRFSGMEEDAAPLRLLVSDYDTHL